MKRVALLALSLAFGISCDDSPTSPSDPNVKKFTAILLPSNEVPVITNADAAASGTMQLTMTVTRDAAGVITGATYDFQVNFTGFPQGTTLTGAHIHNAPANINAAVVVGLAVDGVRYLRSLGPGIAEQDQPAKHIRDRHAGGHRAGDLQQPGRQLFQRAHDDQYGRRHPRAVGAVELEELA